MIKRILLGLIALVGIAIAVLWFAVGRDLYDLYRATAPHTTAEEYAQQDDSRIDIPPLQASEAQPYNPQKNVYWGDVHVHTVVSFDAVLFGTTATVEDAYRFAKGEKLRSAGGELMQLSRPLDFVAITDHAESFGLRNRCGDDGRTLVEAMNCWMMETPNVLTFQLFRRTAKEEGPEEPITTPAGVYQNRTRRHPRQAQFPICSRGEGGPERCE